MDEFVFFDDETSRDQSATRPAAASRAAWKVIIADDEPEVHRVTHFALTGFRFEKAGLRFLNAYSAAEALTLVAENPDAAILLLDVVMESEHAGLEIVHRIRQELDNQRIRIVLRTGQPGKAPEADVIARYDINDYREKTEMTGPRLATVMRSCLRAFRDITTIEASKRGLEKIIDASATIFRLQSADKFAEGVLEQLDALLNLQDGAIYAKGRSNGIAASGRRDEDLAVVAATGKFTGSVGRRLSEVLPEEGMALLRAQMTDGGVNQDGNRYFGVYRGSHALKVLFVEGCKEINELDRKLLDIFSRNISVGFENLQLKESIEETQREIAYRLGGAVESRSRETANHIRRVSLMSALIGSAYGMTERETEVLQHASPLHDVGKIGIPDHVLNKPGKHTPAEWEIMKTHAVIGHDLLGGSDQEILQVGAMIALEHHERWDGGGYPYRKTGLEIGVHGRIVAAIDVFDALGSRRCYKEPWPLDKILELMRHESGKQLDPDVVALMIENLGPLVSIREAHPDIV
jgi:response regulator RpfG family c-di-GMP phosphodiesterase